MRPKIYIEACPLIDMAEHTVGPDKNGEKRNVWFCNQALRAGRDEACDIYTSLLSIAECTSVAAELPNPPDEVKRFYEMLLISGKSGIKLISITHTIALKARDIRWGLGVNLKGADSIHVASAMAQQCDEIWTRDGRIWTKREQIEALGLKVVQPSQTKVLPDKYRQDEMTLMPNPTI